MWSAPQRRTLRLQKIIPSPLRILSPFRFDLFVAQANVQPGEPPGNAHQLPALATFLIGVFPDYNHGFSSGCLFETTISPPHWVQTAFCPGAV